MRRVAGVLVVVAVALLVVWTLPAGAHSHRSDAQRLDLARDLFQRANAEREARGIEPLQWDGRLADLAADWAAHMAGTGASDHRDGATAHTLDGELFRWFSGVGENVTNASGSLAHVGVQHRELMKSDTHRANLLSAQYDAVGIGVVCDAAGRLWTTQDFGVQRAHEFDGEEPWGSGPPPAEPVAADDRGPGCATGEVDVPTPRPTLTREYAAPRGVTPAVDRLGGRNRIETAAALAEAAWPDGSGEVLLARADDYADALAGGALAGAADAPILLTGRDRLHPEVAVQIARLAPDRITALGGASAVSEAVLDDAAAAVGATTDRVDGDDRFATAAAIADRVETLTAGVDRVMVAEGGDGWPDAVAASAVAAAAGVPLLLTPGDGLAEAAAGFLARSGAERAVLLGGPATLDDRVAEDLAAAGVATERVAGDGRFDTASRLRSRAEAAGLDASDPWLVTLADWPDSLAVGPAAARAGALPYHVDGTNPDRDPSDAYAAIAERLLGSQAADEAGKPDDAAGAVDRLRPVGGPSAVNPDTVQEVLVRTLER